MMSGGAKVALGDEVDLRCHAYAAFVEKGTPPETSLELFHLMSVMPLADPKAPVDYLGNMRRICAHAKWKSKEQLEEILDDIQDVGRIDGATAEAILHENFPPELSYAQSIVQARHNQPIQQQI